MRRLVTYKLLLAALVAGIVGASAAAYVAGGSERTTARELDKARVERVKQINEINRAQCESLRNLYGIIRQTLSDSDAQINRLAYYRAHRAEARLIHRQNQRTLSRFRTPPCPRDIMVPVK